MKNIMGFFMDANKIGILFLLISATLFSTSFAGQLQKSMVWKKVSTYHKEKELWALRRSEESDIQERLLNVKTNDYGRYDPTPALVKPPCKQILH